MKEKDIIKNKQEKNKKEITKNNTKNNKVITLNKSSIGIRPLFDKVLIEPIPKEEKTNSGLIISSNNEEKKYEGIVIAVGTGRIGDDNEIIPISLNMGDRVIFAKYGGDEIDYKGKKYTILREDQVLAVID